MMDALYDEQAAAKMKQCAHAERRSRIQADEAGPFICEICGHDFTDEQIIHAVFCQDMRDMSMNQTRRGRQ